MSLYEINSKLDDIQNKVDKLEESVEKNKLVRTHPIIFIILMVGLFIALDLWSATAQSTMRRFHPQGYLQYWEYAIFALVALLIVIFVARKSNMQIAMLNSV